MEPEEQVEKELQEEQEIEELQEEKEGEGEAPAGEEDDPLTERERQDRRFMAQMEAILFAMGDSVSLERIAQAVLLDETKAKELLSRLEAAYEGDDRGIRLLHLENHYQLCTKKEFCDVLIRIAMQPKKPVLTDVLLETLSIVAYKQPVTKVEIEKIRGVKSDHAVNKLIEWGLVREVGRLDAPGKPILLGTTEEFLRTFGVEGLDELPGVDPVKMEDFKAEAESEAAKVT